MGQEFSGVCHEGYDLCTPLHSQIVLTCVKKLFLLPKRSSNIQRQTVSSFNISHPMSFACCPGKCHMLLNHFGSCNSLVAWVRSFPEFATRGTTHAFVAQILNFEVMNNWTPTDFSCMHLDQFLSCSYRLRITSPTSVVFITPADPEPPSRQTVYSLLTFQ